MQKKTVKTLQNGNFVAVAFNQFDEGKVDWALFESKKLQRYPILSGSFQIERYMDGSWLPYEETFDEDTKNMWPTIARMCYKIGMRKQSIYVPKFVDGDIVVSGWKERGESCSWVAIIDDICAFEEDYYVAYCGVYLTNTESIGMVGQIWINECCTAQDWTRKATEEEKLILFKALEKEGLEWDDSKNKLNRI